MGFNIEVNSILRTDEQFDLAVGAILPFEKSGSRIFFDNIPVWLTDKNWRALAEISIVRQERKDNTLSGEFRVDYLYEGEEQRAVTNMFIRMYDGIFDSDIYVLSSRAETDAAEASMSVITIVDVVVFRLFEGCHSIRGFCRVCIGGKRTQIL